MASSFDKPEEMIAVNRKDLDVITCTIADLTIKLHQMIGVTDEDFRRLVNIMDKVVERQHYMLRYAKSITDLTEGNANELPNNGTS
jgi:hypothetical protein